MTQNDYSDMFSECVDQVEDITLKAIAPSSEILHLLDKSRTMRANEDAQVYAHLNEAFDEIRSTVGSIQWSSQKHRKIIKFGLFELEVTVIHRETELEKLTGVDVLYNVGDIKILLFQHKKRSNEGRLISRADDHLQRQTIQRECHECSKTKIISRGRFVKFHCASMYVIGDVASVNRHVVSACLLPKYTQEFNRHDTASKGYSPFSIWNVDRLFTNCEVGRILDPKRAQELASEMRTISLEMQHTLIDATLR
ncbi:MAG: hypothetical protein ACRYFS_13300 [Janthinobacterium lividum]